MNTETKPIYVERPRETPPPTIRPDDDPPVWPNKR